MKEIPQTEALHMHMQATSQFRTKMWSSEERKKI